MRLCRYVKIQTVSSFLLSVDLEREDFTGFTKAFVLEYRELDKTVYNQFEEELVHILEIMRPELKDYQFFVEIRNLLGEINTQENIR